MDTEFLTVTQIGKQLAECKIDLESKTCYIRVTIPYTHLILLPIFGISIFPWLYTHKYVVYYNGWEYDWHWSDHSIRSESTYYEKLDREEHVHDVSLLHNLWLNHSVRLVSEHITHVGEQLQSLLRDLLLDDDKDDDM